MTVNSKEEYSEGFCPNVQEFDLRGFSAKNTVSLIVCESWQWCVVGYLPEYTVQCTIQSLQDGFHEVKAV